MEENIFMVGAGDVHRHVDGVECPECRARRERERQNEELSFAFLLSIVPAIALTLFGNMGLL